jgi:CBS domain-containing protein
MFVGIILLVSYFAEASGINGAVGALLLGMLFAQMPKADYDEEVRGLRAMANGVFIPIFFAGVGMYFSFAFLNLPYYLIAAVLGVVTFGKFGGAIAAAAIARLKPILAVGTGVMAKGPVDLALILSLLSVGLIQSDLFSLVVFGIIVMILASSFALKKGLGLKSSSASEVARNVSVDVAADSLTPLYTRTVLGELKVKDVITENAPTALGEVSVRVLADKHREFYNPAYIAMTKDGSYLGIVTPEQFRRIRRESWETAIVNDISIKNIKAVKMDEYLHDVVEYMALHDLDLLAVVSDDNSRVLGGVMRRNILQYLSKT